MTGLILPNKTIRDEKQARPKDVAVGISPWTYATVYDKDIIPKHGEWKTYYQMYRQHSIVRAAINKVAIAATNVGFDFVPRDSRSRIRKGELTILKDFFDRQQDFMYELRRIYRDMLIYGDAFMYVVPDRTRRPHSLKRLAPWTIAVRTATNGSVVGYVQFDESDPTNQTYVTFESHELLHFKMDDPDNDLYGLSPLSALLRTVESDIYAQNYNISFFKNSGITGTIISVNGVDQDEIQRNRQFLMEHYTGPSAAHKPIFLEGDNVSVEKSVVSHTDMGFLQGREFNILEILAVIDVPPSKIGIMESANRSNSKEQDKSFRTESVSPLQVVVENVLNGQFIRPILGVENTIFVHSEGDTRDAVELMNYYTKGIAWGIYNPNEVRAKMGMAPVDGGEVNGIMTPTGFVPLDRLNLYFKLAKPNTDVIPETGKDPVAGEPTPKNTVSTEIATGQSREVAKAMQDKFDAAKDGMYILLRPQEDISERDIVKAYSYFKDAEGADPAFDSIGTLLKRIKNEDDEDLRGGYFERIKDTFNDWVIEREEANEEH